MIAFVIAWFVAIGGILLGVPLGAMYEREERVTPDVLTVIGLSGVALLLVGGALYVF